jgi:deoxycytidylate deaminase
MGYNGMPAGWENNCEHKEYMSGDAGGWLSPEEIYEQWPFEEKERLVDPDEGFFITTRRYRLKTRPEVLHAESNAIAKLAKSNDSGLGADIFVTHAPCIECSKLIFQSGISRVYYSSDYRDDSGVKFLKQSGVEVIKHDE